jgi:hypothetical protein
MACILTRLKDVECAAENSDMSAYRIIMTAALAITSAVQSPAPPAKPSPASIRGIVLDGASNQPIYGAVVELTGVRGGQVLQYSDVTGRDGRFELSGLQPANGYQLVASDIGNYRTAAFGQHTPSDPWSPISLTAGQNLTDVRIVLTPVSSISGKVIDASGKGLGRAQVYALRATYSSGRRVLLLARQAQTSDNGEYFMGGLESGQYYIRTNPSNSQAEFRQLFENPASWDLLPNPKEGEPEGFPAFYYPGTMELAAAGSIDLLNGGRVRDINIRATKIRTHRVTGMVFAETGVDSAPQPAAKARMLLVPVTAGSESNLTRWKNSTDIGQFDFRGVFPGSYFLIAIASGNPAQLTARKRVEIRDSDVTNLSITAARGFDIAGSIRFKDWQLGPPPDYSQLAITLITDITPPIDRSFRGYPNPQPRMTVVPTSFGQFSLRDVPPGEYRLLLSLNPRLPMDARLPLDLKAAYMSAVKLGTVDVLTNGLHVDGKLDGALQIEVATNSGSIFGRVLEDNRETAVPARMVVVPDKELRKRLDLFFQVPVSPTGRFTMDGIPPGNYKLFAWAHVEDGAWLDPNFMRVYENRGTPIQIEESGAHPIEVQLIH